MALNRRYNVCETAALVFARDEESEAEISDSDVDFPLSDSKNEPITSDDSSDKEGETTTMRQSQLHRGLSVNSLDSPSMEENFHSLPDRENERISVIIDKRTKECVVLST